MSTQAATCTATTSPPRCPLTRWVVWEVHGERREVWCHVKDYPHSLPQTEIRKGCLKDGFDIYDNSPLPCQVKASERSSAVTLLICSQRCKISRGCISHLLKPRTTFWGGPELTAAFTLQETYQTLWENSLGSAKTSPISRKCENIVCSKCNWVWRCVPWDDRNCQTFWYTVNTKVVIPLTCPSVLNDCGQCCKSMSWSDLWHFFIYRIVASVWWSSLTDGY